MREPRDQADGSPPYSRQVADQERRKLRAAHSPIWAGLGRFGMIGWSVAAPTLLGGLLGRWLDRKHPATHPWTLPLLVAGLVLGCAAAWHWVTREQRSIDQGDKP